MNHLEKQTKRSFFFGRTPHIVKAQLCLALAFVLVASLLMLSSIQISSAVSYSNQTLSPAASSICKVVSGGVEQKYMYTMAVPSSDHSKAYAITGAEIARNVVGGSNKVYLFVFVNPGKTYSIDKSGITSSCTSLFSRSTNNVYWYGQDGPNGRDLGTVGGDVVKDPATGLLLADQYIDIHHYPGQTVRSKPASSSGPVSCFVDTLGQERNSIYLLFANSATHEVYSLSGSSIVERSSGGVKSTVLYEYLSSKANPYPWSRLSNPKCTVTLPSPTSEFEWAVRAPPPNNRVPGNYKIYGTVGGDVFVASSSAIACDQFLDPGYQF